MRLLMFQTTKTVPKLTLPGRWNHQCHWPLWSHHFGEVAASSLDTAAALAATSSLMAILWDSCISEEHVNTVDNDSVVMGRRTQCTSIR
jgi:hypothetical protein